MSAEQDYDKIFYVRSSHTPDKMKYVTYQNDHVHFDDLHEICKSFFGHDGYFVITSCQNNIGTKYIQLPLFIRNDTHFYRYHCYLVDNTDVWFIQRDYADYPLT